LDGQRQLRKADQFAGGFELDASNRHHHQAIVSSRGDGGPPNVCGARRP
jgi:hypothetical protein